MTKDKTELKVGDWVHVMLVGLDSGNEPAYQIEKIEKDDYYVVQTDRTYKHRITTTKEKLRKL
jgi:hypothetical protein|tara:strand:- start:1225 stop:1413 length:189 start_codon:yes stop_codon:yes gene_type:complete